MIALCPQAFSGGIQLAHRLRSVHSFLAALIRNSATSSAHFQMRRIRKSCCDPYEIQTRREPRKSIPPWPAPRPRLDIACQSDLSEQQAVLEGVTQMQTTSRARRVGYGLDRTLPTEEKLGLEETPRLRATGFFAATVGCALRVSDAVRAGAGQLAAPPPAAIRRERPRWPPA
jgi:hypothetical protein